MASTIKVDEILDSQGNQFDGSQLGNVGKVLQVKHMQYSTPFSTSSSSFIDTGLSIDITPTSSSSKFLVIWTQHAYLDNYGNWNGYRSKLLRNTTTVYEDPYDISIAMYTNNLMMKTTEQYLDSPNTTSIITYKTQIEKGNNTSPISLNHGGAVSMMTVMEIGE